MCGIAFLLDRRADRSEITRRMHECLDAMRHRGPDDWGIEHSGEALLGHRRLSIIDLSGSKQPMHDPGQRYVLSYNGEIYNYMEVRSRLTSRWDFRTRGDTEVLLAGLVLEGVEFLSGLEGMWAFTLWDRQENRLLMGRDRMGKKPLYYQVLPGGGFACASELPALRRLHRDDWREDQDSSADFLRYGFQLPGYTAWLGVHELPPGHVGHWVPGGEVRQQPWWALRVQSGEDCPDRAVRVLRETLVLAVEKRLVADVEVGAFLSGGVDSSLICGIIRRELDRPLKTFTIGFSDHAYDERRYAREVANVFQTEHYEDVLDQWDESELEKLLLNHLGQPFGDTSLLPTSMVSRVASRQVKVALSGDGGDELFSGYQRYQARLLLSWYTRLPRSLRGNLQRLIRLIPEPGAHHSRSLIKKAHLFLDIVDKQEAETPYYAPLQISPKRMSALCPALLARGHDPLELPAITEPGDLQRMMMADSCIYLPQDILVKVDRASMAESLELRAPFLDSKVVEQAFSMPTSWHRRRFAGKHMLRKSFADLLPNSIWQRRKQGFGMPLHEWFRGSLGQKLRQWLLDDPGPFDPVACGVFLDEHCSRKRDHGYRLWQIYVYLLWRRSSGLKGCV